MRFPLALCFLLGVAAVMGASSSDQSFVIVGNADLERSLASSPSLDVPTILMEVGSDSDSGAELDSTLEHELEAEVGLVSPFFVHENEMIAENQAELSHVELLAQQLGAPVISDLMTEKAEHDVSVVEHSLISQASAATHEAEHENQMENVDHLDLENVSEDHMEAESSVVGEADAEASDEELNMVELSTSVSDSPDSNKYALLDDPKFGSQPTVLKNLKGLDIYVVNTAVQDNDNEIRPVSPPHPMSAADREKARLAKLMRSQLIHDVPRPKPAVAPRTRINTMSAYESSLTDLRGFKQKRLEPLHRWDAKDLAKPLVGGHGAMQLKGFIKNAKKARFAQVDAQAAAEAEAEALAGVDSEAQLPGTGALPRFPRKEPAAARGPVVTVPEVSFDMRDGPPKLLDDLLPLKAQLVEELDPLGPRPAAQESRPNGW